MDGMESRTQHGAPAPSPTPAPAAAAAAVLHFAQISDLHLMADPEAEIDGVRPYARFAAAVDLVRSLSPVPDLVVLSGDLIDDDSPRAYEHVRDLAQRLPGKVRFVVGNHDVRPLFRSILLGESSTDTPCYREDLRGGVRWIFLDSKHGDDVWGEIDPEQMDWLRDALARSSPGTPTMVFVHHPPTRTGVPWHDEHVIRNGDALLDLLADNEGVLAVCYGHLHMATQQVVIAGRARRGILCASAPSTAWQYGDRLVTPKRSAGPAGIVVGTVSPSTGRVTLRTLPVDPHG